MDRLGARIVFEDCEDVGATTAAVFALAERLTGVRVSETMLGEAVFLCGTACLST